MDIVEQLPDGEKELYFAQQMGLDLEAIPVNQRIPAARKFYAAKSPRQWKTLRPFQTLTHWVTTKTAMLSTALPQWFTRGAKRAGSSWKTTKTQDFLRQTRSHNASKDFQNDDGGVFTNKYRLEDGSFDVESFNAENPGIIPVDKEGNINPDDRITKQRIRRVEDAIDRGTAVKQQNINRGYMQNLQSPTLRPMMMKQSLDQTDNLREKAQIAYAHGDPTLAAMFMQMDADDTALLKAEAEGRANAEPEEFNPEQPGAVSNIQINQLQRSTNTTGLATELAATGNMTAEETSDYAAKQGVRALKDRMPVKMILADPQVMSSLDGKLEGQYGLMDEVPDAMQARSSINPTSLFR